MARSRNIKPAFFLNEALAECQPLARILFAGLWCAADREGRLADRPKRLKVELLPYDDADVDALLSELAARGFVMRYMVDGTAYIAIINFTKHQNPHHREGPSLIPAPARSESVPDTALVKPEESLGLGPDEARQRLGSAVLIPDSGFLIPDSLQERAPAAPSDPVKCMIDGGIEYFATCGVAEKQARSVIGMARKELKDDGELAGLLARMQQEQVVQPVPWLLKSTKCRQPGAAKYMPLPGEF